MKTKTILLTILISVLIVFTNSCEKHYPKDIPIWLKNKIKQMEKDKKPCYDIPILVQEYKNNSTDDVIYIFTKACSHCHYEIYDYYGSLLCIKLSYLNNSDSCGNILFSDYSFTRNIWREKCN